jgi:hypothetical protein
LRDRRRDDLMAVDLLNGLIAYFRMNEELSNAHIGDSHQSLYLTQTGNPGDAAGKLNRARDFSALGKYGVLPNTATICSGALDIRKNPQVDFTRSFWVQFNSINVGVAQWLWEQYDDNTATGGGFLCAKGAGDTLLFVKWNTDLTNEIVDSGVTPTAGPWFHIVTALDTSGGNMIIWVNGTKYTQAYTKQVETGGAPDFTIGQFVFGASSSALAKICDFACYDRLLGDDEVAALYNAGSGIDYTHFKYNTAPVDQRFLTNLTDFWTFEGCDETFSECGAHSGKHGGTAGMNGAWNVEAAGAPNGTGQSRNAYDAIFGDGSWQEVYGYSDFDLADGAIGDWSMSVWIKPNSTGIAADHVYWEQYDANPNEGYIMRWNNASTYFELIGVDGAGASKSVNTGSIGALTNTWHHLVYGYDSGTQKMFIQLNGGTRQIQSTTLTSIRNSTAVMSMGKWVANNTAHAKCSMANWAFWNGRVISSAESVTLYDSGASIDYHDMALYTAQRNLFDNVSFRSGDWNVLTFGASACVKSGSANVSGYCRPVVTPKDDSSATTDYATRYARLYYFMPSKNYWHWAGWMGDTTISRGVREDGVRFYVRYYNNDQYGLVDAPCIIPNTTYPRTFIHPSETAADEVLTYTGVVNADAFLTEFYWMPTFPPFSVRADLELFRMSVDATNYISLSLLAPTDKYQREYNVNDAYGMHDPTFRVEKFVGGVSEGTLDIVCYYTHNFQENAGERFEDVIKFTIGHLAEDRLTFRLEKFGFQGQKQEALNTAYGGDESDLIFQGYGYFSEPRILDEDSNQYGRLVPTSRVGARGRVSSINREAILSGERDTSVGQLIGDLAFAEGTTVSPLLPNDTDDFTRADNANLGTSWDVIKQTGAGFNIVTNQADCVQEGFESYAMRPRHQDTIVSADLIINNDTDVVGIMTRYDQYIGDVSAIGAEIIQTGAAAATLRLVRWWKGTRYILDSSALTAYTQGDSYRVTLTSSGDSFSVTCLDVTTLTSQATAAATDAFLKRPGKIGIYGQTGGAGQHVQIDRIRILPNFSNRIVV